MRLPVALLVATLAGCAASPPPPVDPDAPEIQVDNAAWIVPGQLARGGQPDAEGLRHLKDLGFRTIVNLRSFHTEATRASMIGLKVVEIPMRADIDDDPPTDEQIERFFRTVLDPEQRPVFFHCAQGCDRTGVMAALYRMEVDGWSNEQAIDEMRRFGFHRVYRDLERFVRGYRPRGYARRPL